MQRLNRSDGSKSVYGHRTSMRHRQYGGEAVARRPPRVECQQRESALRTGGDFRVLAQMMTL
jgi:hypothetical protein